jgi:hypothetical protein
VVRQWAPGEEELSLLMFAKHGDAGDTNTTYAWRMMATAGDVANGERIAGRHYCGR